MQYGAHCSKCGTKPLQRPDSGLKASERRHPDTSLLGDSADQLAPRPVTAHPLARFLGQHEAHLTAWFLIGLRHLLLSANLPFPLPYRSFGHAESNVRIILDE